VRIHRDLMRFAFLNILKNAIEAVKSGGKSGSIKITIGLKEGDTSVVSISFFDNGIGLREGISPKVLVELGTSFNKDNDNLERSNHGVGLFVTDYIIKLHGGIFSITSADGGTEVVVLLPRDETKREKRDRKDRIEGGADDSDDEYDDPILRQQIG